MWEKHIVGLYISKYRVVKKKKISYREGCDDRYYIDYS